GEKAQPHVVADGKQREREHQQNGGQQEADADPRLAAATRGAARRVCNGERVGADARGYFVFPMMSRTVLSLASLAHAFGSLARSTTALTMSPRLDDAATSP